MSLWPTTSYPAVAVYCTAAPMLSRGRFRRRVCICCEGCACGCCHLCTRQVPAHIWVYCVAFWCLNQLSNCLEDQAASRIIRLSACLIRLDARIYVCAWQLTTAGRITLTSLSFVHVACLHLCTPSVCSLFSCLSLTLLSLVRGYLLA